MPFLEILIVLVLVLLNAVLAAAELSIVSSRPARLRSMAAKGRSGAQTALALAAEPGRFLSTVQAGITLIGILAGAFSGASLGAQLSTLLREIGVPSGMAGPLGYIAVVAAITYVSLVIGELIPKRLALRNPEPLACMLAPLMVALSRISAPMVWLLDASTRTVLRLLGVREDNSDAVTDEEIRAMITDAESAGVIRPDERRMISGVMRLADRPVEAIMTPRTEVEWVDITQGPEKARAQLLASPHSRLPACEGSSQEAIGVIQAKRVLDAWLRGENPDPRDHVQNAPYLVETLGALDAMRILRSAEVPMGIVVDEYGDMAGVVTGYDLLLAITGTMHEDALAHEHDPASPRQEGAVEGERYVVRRQDGSYLVAGDAPMDELRELLRVDFPEDEHFHTVAGFALARLKSMPQEGDVFTDSGWRFEIVDMDGRRIDKLLVSRSVTPRRQNVRRRA
ncbi:hemolysin family protein [Xanthobacter sp. TB0136]|uniref:hemolysin family protein n=1 Tax=Xanthobacter sp. TB0136 TaxID=3459177 RepID=UPI00403A32AC